MYKSCTVTYKSCQRERKINYYSWFLSRGKLIKWIYKETETEIDLTEKQKKKKKNLITNTLETTKLKPYVMLGPFQT